MHLAPRGLWSLFKEQCLLAVHETGSWIRKNKHPPKTQRSDSPRSPCKERACDFYSWLYHNLSLPEKSRLVVMKNKLRGTRDLKSHSPPSWRTYCAYGSLPPHHCLPFHFCRVHFSLIWTNRGNEDFTCAAHSLIFLEELHFCIDQKLHHNI